MPKPLSHAERGRMGAAAKWGAHRKVFLDDLSEPERSYILSLVRARKNANGQTKGDGETKGASPAELTPSQKIAEGHRLGTPRT